MKKKLTEIRRSIIDELKRTQTLDQLEQIYSRYFSRTSGELSRLSKDLKKVAEEQRPVVGKLLNEVKTESEKLFDEIKRQIGHRVSESADHENMKQSNNGTIEQSNIFDLTLPGHQLAIGKLHILTQIRYEIEDIFRQLGFMVADGPELESEWYNFEALNVSKDHPARDMQDTFYIKTQNSINKTQENSNLVMRTHTSNVQVRAMEKYGAPLRCIAPGRVYRNEATDSRHEHTFHQIEGLMVDENISIANLKAVVDTMIKAMLGEQYQTRIRPGYFPFVEPGLEVDLFCVLCHGQGCRVCKNTGWMEFCGAGMVHPRVLIAGGVDPKQYSGFAFGFGLERIAMMKYGIDDIRLFESGDLRFLRQF